MNDADFWAEMRANPLDDLPREAYADWLDELGDPKAEFIRGQVRLASLDPNGADAEVLSARLAYLQRKGLLREWERPLEKHFDHLRWWRGLMIGLFPRSDSPQITAEELEHVPLFGLHVDGVFNMVGPVLIEQVLPSGDPSNAKKLFRPHPKLTVIHRRGDSRKDAVPPLRKFRELQQFESIGDFPPEPLFTEDHSSFSPRLRRLATSQHNSVASWWEALVGNVRFPEVESFSLFNPDCIGDAAAQRLFRGNVFPSLRHLSFGSVLDNILPTSSANLFDFANLVQSPLSRKLESLHVHWEREPGRGRETRRLRSSPPKTLKRLSLDVSDFGPEHIEELAQWGWLSQIESLAIHMSGSSGKRAQILLPRSSLPNEPTLRCLKLSLVRLQRRDIETLARSRWCSRIEALHLNSCHLDDDDVIELLGGRWSRLRCLSLQSNHLTGRTIEKLLGTALANRLEVLKLYGNDFGGDVLELLAKTGMARLRKLSLGEIVPHPRGVRIFGHSTLAKRLFSLTVAMPPDSHCQTMFKTMLPQIVRVLDPAGLPGRMNHRFWPRGYWIDPSLK